MPLELGMGMGPVQIRHQQHGNRKSTTGVSHHSPGIRTKAAGVIRGSYHNTGLRFPRRAGYLAGGLQVKSAGVGLGLVDLVLISFLFEFLKTPLKGSRWRRACVTDFPSLPGLAPRLVIVVFDRSCGFVSNVVIRIS